MMTKIIEPFYYSSARLITEFVTLEDEKRKVTYLNPFVSEQATSIADHVVGSLLIGKILGQLTTKNTKRVDQNKLDSLVLWHDSPETRYGDIGRDRRKYVLINEDKARADIFGTLPWGEEILSLIENFEAGGEDINIKLARDADALYVICTIKDFLRQNIPVNNPEQRISNTLKRLSTDEALELGTIIANLAVKKPWNRELLKMLDDKSMNFNLATPTMTTLGIGWMLSEIAKLERVKGVDRNSVLQNLLGSKNKISPINKSLAKDSINIYEIVNAKRLMLKTGKIRKIKSGGNFNTKQGKTLAEIIVQTNPFDWWQILMGYGTVNNDGTIIIVQK